MNVCSPFFSLFCLGAALLVGGCAGGGSATPLAGATASTLFEPNYFSSLDGGRQWSRSTIRYQVNASGSRDLTRLINAALSAWSPHSDGLLTLTPVLGSASELSLTEVPEGTLGERVIGLTTVTFRSSDKKITRATIRVDQSLDDELMVQVIAHELGHALGLDGHSPDAADLMYPHAHLPLVVTERDRNTFLTIYANLLAGQSRSSETQNDGSEQLTTVVCQYKRD